MLQRILSFVLVLDGHLGQRVVVDHSVKSKAAAAPGTQIAAIQSHTIPIKNYVKNQTKAVKKKHSSVNG